MSSASRSTYWFEDGSAIISVEDLQYRIHQSFVARLSPKFFTEFVKPLQAADTGEKVPAFEIKGDLHVTQEEFSTLCMHLYHNFEGSPLEGDSPSNRILELLVVTSPAKLDFNSIHNAVLRALRPLLFTRPLDIEFDDHRLLQEASIVIDAGDDIKTALKRALIYAYTVHPNVSFGTSPNSTHEEAPTDTGHQVTGEEAAMCERLMIAVAEHFSPTLFQPPAARHMACTDVYAAVWMDCAVQPTFAGEGTANPFATMRRWRAMDWKMEDGAVEDDGDARTQPCEECLKALREEWEEEALNMWNMMDQWMNI